MRATPLLLAMLAACHGGADFRGASEGSDVVIDAPSIVLHEAGQEPRRVLRYTVSDYSRKVHFTQEITGDPQFAKETIEWHCLPCTYRIAEFSLSGDTWSAARKIHGEVVLTADGRMQFKVAAVNVHITPDPTEYLMMFMVPFPVEPVGVGATWSGELAGFRMDYSLVVLSDTIAKVHVDQHYDGPTDRHIDGTLTVTFTDPVAFGTLSQRITGNDGVELPDPTTFTFD